MTLAVVLALGLVALSMRGEMRDWLSPEEHAWYWFLVCLLVGAATAIRNLWLAAAVVWIAFHPFVQALCCHWKISPIVVTGKEVYRYHWTIAAWVMIYLAIQETMTIQGFRFFAAALIVWATFNAILGLAVALGWNRSDMRDRNFHPCAQVGASYFLAWLCAAALLAVPGLRWWWAVPPLLAGLVVCRNTAAIGSAAVAALVCFHPSAWLYGVVAVGAVASAPYAWTHTRLSWVPRWTIWKVALAVTWASRGLGIGLGTWHALGVRRKEEEDTNIVWTILHNDWLQAAAEIGIVPVLLGLAVVVRSVVVSTNPTATAWVVFSAVYALVYFPFHVHHQALLVAVALGVLR